MDQHLLLILQEMNSRNRARSSVGQDFRDNGVFWGWADSVKAKQWKIEVPKSVCL